MGTRYVITLMQVDDIEDAESRYETRDMVLFEATHRDPTRLARFAPVEILEALAAAGDVAIDSTMGLLPQPAWWRNGDTVAMNGAYMAQAPEMTAEEKAAAEVEPEPEPEPEGEKPKRSRRTKAQIAADKAAQELGYRDAAHRAEAEAADVAVEGGPVEPVAAGGLPTAQSEAAVAEVFGDPESGKESAPAAGGSVQPAPASPPPAAPSLPAPAFNPFL